MKPTITIILLALLLAGTAIVARADEEAPPPADQPAAEEPAPDPLEDLPDGLRNVLERMEAANEKVETVKARVTYERLIPLLDEKQKARGSLTFKKPGLIALKLGKGRNEEVYTNGEKWWVVSHDEEQVEVYEAADPGDEAGAESAFLDFGYGDGVIRLLDDYDVELVETIEPEDDDEPVVYHLKLTPYERPDRPARYAAIEIKVADDQWLPIELVLHESGGEIIHTYALSRIELNEDIKDEVFEYDPPGGYNVVTM